MGEIAYGECRVRIKYCKHQLPPYFSPNLSENNYFNFWSCVLELRHILPSKIHMPLRSWQVSWDKHIHLTFFWEKLHARTADSSTHSVLSDFVTLWTVAHQAPLSMGFSRQEYWSGLPFPSRGIFWPKDWTILKYKIDICFLKLILQWRKRVTCMIVIFIVV